VLLLVLACWSAPAATAATVAVSEAPGMESGPLITAAGTVWAGAQGISLRRANGAISVLAPPGAPSFDNARDEAWFGARWWLLATNGGLLAGRIGGPLRRLPGVLQGCNPGSATYTIAPLLAVSGAHLFAALAPACRRRHPTRFGTLISVDLRTRRWSVLARAPGEPTALAAAGPYVALAYTRPRRAGAPLGSGEPYSAVRIWRAGGGPPAATIMPPAQSAAGIGSLQIDERGHVLVSEECCSSSQLQATIAQPLRREDFWVGAPDRKRGVRVVLGRGASLSDGRIAYVSVAYAPTSAIEILTLASGARRTVATFSGTVGVSGLMLAGDELAWGQRSSALVGDQSGCGTVFLTPPQLASVDLRKIPAEAFTQIGPPAPPSQGRECVVERGALP
jgi:hypothetical protein